MFFAVRPASACFKKIISLCTISRQSVLYPTFEFWVLVTVTRRKHRPHPQRFEGTILSVFLAPCPDARFFFAEHLAPRLSVSPRVLTSQIQVDCFVGHFDRSDGLFLYRRYFCLLRVSTPASSLPQFPFLNPPPWPPIPSTKPGSLTAQVDRCVGPPEFYFPLSPRRILFFTPLSRNSIIVSP